MRSIHFSKENLSALCMQVLRLPWDTWPSELHAQVAASFASPFFTGLVYNSPLNVSPCAGSSRTCAINVPAHFQEPHEQSLRRKESFEAKCLLYMGSDVEWGRIELLFGSLPTTGSLVAQVLSGDWALLCSCV